MPTFIMAGMMQKLAGRLLVGLAFVLLLAALWPNAGSLYGLTGEEELPGKVAGIGHWLVTAVRPQPRLAPELYAPTISSVPFGINTFLEQEVEVEKRARSLALIHEAGFRFIRQEFPWEDIEIHGKGDFEDRRHEPARSAWEKYDNIVALANEQGIEVIARLSNPPDWSRMLPAEEVGTNAPPDDFQDYADFVTAVATRYKGQIHYYQLWNEPNGNEEWGKQNVDPEAYTQLLCMGYEAIKAADPEAVVLAGALTPTVAMDGRNMNDLIFLQRMYNAGAGNCFDVMSAQGYGLFSGAADQRLRPNVINFPHHEYIRDVMVRNGDGRKPLWISEMGWNTVPDHLPAVFGRVTETQQAQYAVQAYQRIREQWPWVEVSNYWFFKRAADYERGQPFYYFRMMEPDFTPLPVYEAMAAYTRDLPAAEPMPAWQYRWRALRPFLFTIGASILFFALLYSLHPKAANL